MPTLPKAIICDIDGTLAHRNDRSPYDWHRVGEDKLDKIILEILTLAGSTDILLISGRDACCRDETIEWLKRHKVPYDALFMRLERDNRKDNVVKLELYEQHIKGKYDILFVLDDRNQVVKMWREQGLKCLQVAEGDF